LAHIAIWVYMLVAVVVALSANTVSRKWRVYGVYLALLVVLGYGVFNLASDGNVTLERAQTPKAREIRNELAQMDADCSDEVTVVADGPFTYIEAIYYYDECDVRFYYPE